MITIDQGLKLLRLSERVLSGDLTEVPDLLRALADVGLDLAPVDELKQHLTDAAVARDNAIADLASRAKFGP